MNISTWNFEEKNCEVLTKVIFNHLHLKQGIAPGPVQQWYEDRRQNQDCRVRKNSNPIWYAGTLTLEQCMARCDVSTDSKGRRCVAIEWEDDGREQSSKTKRKCHLAWSCDFTGYWRRGSIFKKFLSAAHASPALITIDPFDTVNAPDVGDPLTWTWTDWYRQHYYDIVLMLCSVLIVLCAITLCVTVRQRQQVSYGVVKQFDTDIDTENECVIDAKPNNQ